SLGEGAIGQRVSVRQESWRLAESCSELIDDDRQRAPGVSGNRRGQLERARPRLGRGRPGRRDGVHAVLPASTVSTVPVMLFAFDPSRNSTAFATSSTSG